MSTITQTCPCGAQITLPSSHSTYIRTWNDAHAICRQPSTRDADSYFRMYLQVQRRYGKVTDAVFTHLAEGDILGLIDTVWSIADSCDYIDTELTELRQRAINRWDTPEYTPARIPDEAYPEHNRSDR
jgi:hypothetical protein